MSTTHPTLPPLLKGVQEPAIVQIDSPGVLDAPAQFVNRELSHVQ